MKNDSQLQKDVYAELKWDPSINEAEIGVTSKEGIVSLIGYVPSYAEKSAAEAAAKRVAGVSAVVNDLEVRLALPQERTDQDIAAAAAHALKWHVWVPQDKVKIVVDDGWIKLSGQVPWEFQKESAELAVRYIEGVRGVTNLITLTPRVSEYNVKEKIQQALARSAREEAQRIKVAAHEGEVQLSGVVHSWSERASAEKAAWSAAGVARVKNELRVQ